MTYMKRSLSLARRALGAVSPNPAVGAVVVKEGKIVGEGWTQQPGQAHAEVLALRRAGAKAAGAVLYTTLEPCSHFGRTPPCTDAIIEAGIAEVCAATIDPNPLVNHSGLSRLQEAGIKLNVGECEEEAAELMEAYAKHITTGLPFVTAKFAMSLDGKIATRSGDSKWITGEESKRYVHELRAASDAIMVGINTVLADDPQLTARDEQGSPLDRQPLRIIVDSRGRMPREARLLAEPGDTLVAVAENATRSAVEQADAEIEVMPAEDGSVDLSSLMRLLGQKDITSVFVEGGGTLLGTLFDQGLIDKVIAFVAPTIIGGKDAPSPIAGLGVEKMADALRLHRSRVMQSGRDVAVIGYCEAESHVHRNR